jgi:hypothetical protein
MGSITLTCGCDMGDLTWEQVKFAYKDWDCDWDGYHKCVSYVAYCPECQKMYPDSDVIHNEQEATEWLKSEK